MITFDTSIIKIEGKIIGIVGSRKRNSDTDLALVTEAFSEIYRPGDVICSGGCPLGGDRFAEVIAKRFGITIIIHHPNWKKFGNQAGYIRNTKIAKDSTTLIACVSEDRQGGTEDTIRKFEKFHPNSNPILV